MKKSLQANGISSWKYQKFVTLMRITALQAAIGIIFCGVVLAEDNYAQGVLNREVTLAFKQVTLKEALLLLEAETKVRFVYSAERIPLHEKVSLDVHKKRLEDVLKELLTPFAIGYMVQEHNDLIVLAPKLRQREQSGIDHSVPDATIQRNYIAISGTVTDAVTHDPLPGVSIFVKSTTNGVISDASGKYEIQAEAGQTLVFTFISYKTSEVVVGLNTIIDVILETEASTLSEIVVNAGYYNVLDKEKTGSIARVSSDVIGRQPVTNALAALQGQTSGVYINQNSGIPGSAFQVRIRGINSLQNGNDPLYVIDGVPFMSESLSDPATSGNLYGNNSRYGQGLSPMNSINPNDIESIEILKDADATAIYGSRGANGVVLITTKRGKAGAVSVDLNVRSGVSMVNQRIDLMNTEQYLAMRMEAVANDGDVIRTGEYDINGRWERNRYTDWQNELLGGTAQMTDANATISGGNNDTQFLFGTGYNTQSTVFPGSNSANRFSTHFSVTHTSPKNKFKARLSTSYSINTNNIVSVDLTSLAISLAPNAPALYMPNGELNWQEGTWGNPLAQTKNRFRSDTYNLITSAELGYQIAKDVSVKVSVGLNDIRNEEKRTTSSDALDPSYATPTLSQLMIGNGTNRSWIIEPQLNWNKSLGKGRLSTLIGATYQYRTGESSRNRYRSFTSNTLIYDPQSAATSELESYVLSEYKYAAVYARLNYTWNDKYIVNVTGRRDGSSRFGPGKQFANLGAVGLAWIFSNEEFIRNRFSFLSFGKLRGSYGITGNDQIGDYRYLDTYRSSSQYNGVASLLPVQLYNPVYGWETNKKLEGALELGFIRDRVTLTVAYFTNRSSNQLIPYRLPATTGNSSVLLNFPATVENNGLEIDINTVNVSTGSFEWTSSVNITFPRNRLVSFPGIETSSYADTYKVGKPLSIARAYHYLGVDPATGKFQFEDMNGDEQITQDDMRTFVEYSQQYFGGFNNGFSFKGIQVNILLQFVRQSGSGFISNGVAPGNFTAGRGNQPTSVLDGRWQQQGDVATYQYFSRSEEINYNQRMLFSVSDAQVQEIYFVRLKNISLAYQLPKRILNGIETTLYAQAQNLFTVTNYAGLDPETGSSSLPPLTTITAGIQIKF